MIPYLLGIDELPLGEGILANKYQFDVDHRTIDELAKDPFLISILKLQIGQTDRQRYNYSELTNLATTLLRVIGMQVLIKDELGE